VLHRELTTINLDDSIQILMVQKGAPRMGMSLLRQLTQV